MGTSCLKAPGEEGSCVETDGLDRWKARVEVAGEICSRAQCAEGSSLYRGQICEIPIGKEAELLLRPLS
jgi:hypothetical protein